MRQVTIRFELGDTVFGVRQFCLLPCSDGGIKVSALKAGAEEWWVPCPCCRGSGTHPLGPWGIREFKVNEITWRHGNWCGSPELLYEELYGDYNRRDYQDNLVFATKEDAEAKVRELETQALEMRGTPHDS